jgi:hypothetical protein
VGASLFQTRFSPNGFFHRSLEVIMTFKDQTIQSPSDCRLACLDFLRQATKDLHQLSQRVVPSRPFTLRGDRENGVLNGSLSARAALRLC